MEPIADVHAEEIPPQEIRALETQLPETQAPEAQVQQVQEVQAQEIRPLTRSRFFALARSIALSAAFGSLIAAIASGVLLDSAYRKIAALEDKARAFEASRLRGERERHIRRWIVAQNPNALMADFDGFAGVLLERSAEHDVDYRVVMAMIQKESHWEPGAIGKDGEIGLMQLLPATAAGLADKIDLEFVPPKRDGRGGYSNLGSLGNPTVNIQLGMAYLRQQLDEFGMQPEALQAYNRGPRRARLAWLWDRYAADVARNFGELVLWGGFPAVAESKGTLKEQE